MKNKFEMVSNEELRLLYEEGKAYVISGNLKTALEKLNKCIEICDEHMSKFFYGESSNGQIEYIYYDILAKAYNAIGVVYKKEEMVITAMTNFVNCIMTLDSYENLSLRAKVYNNMGYIYMEISDYKSAYESFKRAQMLDEGSGYEYMDGIVLVNVAMALYGLGEYEQAFDCCKKMFEVCIDDVLFRSHSSAYAVVALVFEKMGHPKEAEKYYKKAKNQVKAVKDKFQGEMAIIYILEYLKSVGKYEESMSFIESEIVQDVLNSTFSYSKKHIFDIAIEVCTKSKNASKRVEYLNRYRENSKKALISFKDNELSGIKAKTVISKLRHNNENLKVLSETDAMTGLANKGKLNRYLEEAVNKAKEQKLILAIAIIDIDKFKQFNDIYGHLTGDKCIKSVANILNEIAESCNGLAARFGGDEFFLVVERYGNVLMESLCEKLRKSISELGKPGMPMEGIEVSVSIGTYVAVPESYENFMDYIRKADVELYKEKEQKKQAI